MFSLQNVINAQYLLGERAQELKTIVIHPKVAAQLQLQGQLTSLALPVFSRLPRCSGVAAVSVFPTQLLVSTTALR